MNTTKTLTYDDLSEANRCRKIAYALRYLPWTTKEAECYAIFDALDSFRDGGSEVSTVRAVLTALRKTKNGNDFDRVCTWASEWLAYHVCQPRPAIEKEFITDAQYAESDYVKGGQL